MKQDPAYRRNQSRYLHRLHRRNRRSIHFILVIWLVLVSAMTGAATLDVTVGLGWGFSSREVWGGVGMMLFGCVFWLFTRAIMSVNLAITRRLYGPEPLDRPE
jgi:hypothetical protein